MIEWRWGLPTLTPRDAAARNLAEALDFENPPDLTAPHWDVPDPGALAPLTISSLAATSSFGHELDDHADDWARVGDLAAEHGFSV